MYVVLMLTGAGMACGEVEEIPPQPVSTAAPFRYPVPQWDAGVEGDVVLMVHVTAMGAVDTAYVHESSGVPAFDTAALRGVERMIFDPGRRDGERIDAWIRLPVRYRMDGGPGLTDATAPGDDPQQQDAGPGPPSDPSS